MDTAIAFVALIISFVSLGVSVYFWRMQFRPIVSVALKTVTAGNSAITYALQVKNSGSIPAKNVSLKIDLGKIEDAFGAEATTELKEKWVYAINKSSISVIQNGETTTCSFGYTRGEELGFWRHRASIPMRISYSGWFGRHYTENQLIKILDTDSFTGYMWEKNA